MPRKQKKYHYIYKTTCLVTGKFYVGMHSTDNLEDNYLGSGKILGYSRCKYGDENHVREILEYASDRKSLALREKEIVNEDLLKDPLNINLKYGGDGGTHGRESEIWARSGYKDKIIPLISAGNKKRWEDSNYRKKVLEGTARSWLNPTAKMLNRKPPFLGKHCSDEHKKKISESNKKMTGEKNSQYGTSWVIFDSMKPIKIKKDQLDEYISRGYRQGRK